MVRRMKRWGVPAVAGVIVAMGLPPAAAATRHPEAPATQALGTIGAWSAYASHDATGRVCYLAGEPSRSEGAAGGRRQPMAMVTHRPAEHIANVVSFVEGYPLKPGSNVTVDIGGDRKFSLFVKGDSAWAPTSELDRAVTTALSRGRSAIVVGETAAGRRTTDIYSLDGFPKALALIDKACGLAPQDSVLAPPAVGPSPPRHREAHPAGPYAPPAHRLAHKPAKHHKATHKKPTPKAAARPENPNGTPRPAATHPAD